LSETPAPKGGGRFSVLIRLVSAKGKPHSRRDFEVHIITRKRLNEFAEKYPTTKTGLIHRYRVVKGSNFQNFTELRRAFPHADQVGGLTVFNIGGNKARLIAALHYNRRKVLYSRCADPRRIRRGQMERKVIMSTAQIQKAFAAWPQVEPTLRVPHNNREYRQLVKLLDRLVDEVGENETHPLASLMEVLAVLIERYEDENVAELV
jgi:mRNA interferase HigB